MNLETLLETFLAKMSDRKSKLKIDKEDLVNDATVYSKDSSFDPKNPLRIVYKDQSAADTGGVLRQFFMDLLLSLSTLYFIGDECKVPVYNTNVAVAKIIKLIGRTIVHSIIQEGSRVSLLFTWCFHLPCN